METYDNAGAMAGVGMAVFVFALVIGLAVYIFYGYCLKTIAEKTGHEENAWWGWVPILNALLLLQIAGKPTWWIVLLLVPFVNLVVGIIVLMEVAKARGKEQWWGIIAAIVPIVGFPYIAFSNDTASV